MALFKMSIVKTQAFERACYACMSAFGCLMFREASGLMVVAFEAGDGEVIRDTLSEVGSKYIGPLEVEDF